MRDIFIERRERILRIAIKENNLLNECFIEEETEEPLQGEIYKGVIKNIIPAIKCAFIDIGLEKQGYMVVNPRFNRRKELKKGDEIIVEILKEENGEKGPKLIDKYTLPGRYVVLTPGERGIVFSKKIRNIDFIENLKQEIGCFEDFKITVRTNAEFTDIEEIKKEIKELEIKIQEIEREGKYSLKPKKLYGESSIIHKVLRDCINNKTKKVIVDNFKDYSLIKECLVTETNIDLIFHEEKRSLFDYYGIEKEILSLRNNKVPLKCGGNIVIEKTEAMYVVDVNSNKNINGRNYEKNAEETNIEAAFEIGRQIRVRNLSGIILIDFIDMKERENKQKVLTALNEALESDKRKTVIYPFTELNLVQIARKRKGKSIYDYIEEPCKECHGHGKKLKLSYIYLLIKNEILKFEGDSSINNFYIELNKEYERDVRENIFELLREIDGIDKNIYLNFLESVEYYKVEPLIFKNQIQNVAEYRVTNIEKY